MSSENNLDFEETLACIQQNIKEIDIRIPQQESAVIVVGETREGKTTLLNYLTGSSLFGKESDGFGGFEIYVVNSLNNVDINNGSTSQTSLPYNKGEYWDCPVLIVVSEATIIETSKKKLLNLSQKLGETFKNNNNLFEGLCLVVTQCKSLKLENMRNGLLKILEERNGKEGFSSSQRNKLDFLSSDRSQIAFFDAPQEEGPISDEDKSEILHCIEKITYIKNLEPSISIGSYAKSFIRNLIEKFYNDMDKFISRKFDSAFLNHIKDLIDHHERHELHTFENNLGHILSIVKLLKKNDLTEETNDLINNVTRENEISDEIDNIFNNIINKKKASSEMHGKDGSPGNSGYNGGRFYSKGRNFINLSSLTIDISGGDGSKGQDGGNSADGLDGSDFGIKILEERTKSVLFSRKKVSGDLKETVEKGIKFFLTFNEKYKETYVGYDPGQEGGNVPTNIEEKPTIIRENNTKGINGERGSPGYGGKNGPKYFGIYINELVFSGFRDYEEFDNKELDTKFVGGIRVATNATISTATGLTAAVGCKIAETVAKNAVTFAIKEVSKNAIKISPLTGVSFVAGMGVSIAIPLIMPPVSAYFSSYWEKKPYKLDDNESFAFNGNSPNSLNNDKNELSSSNRVSLGHLDFTEYNKIFCKYYQKDDYKKDDYNIFIKPFICHEKLPYEYYYDI
ncbi:hypothetical protein F8M41_006102 [Gigaspora margarita]|uniref:Uncharacterized protein n=1 Tax=Gigaspora margarita TaxID=4874 RepID=A0A8H3X6Z5_GIGMA|nr:hypothetical protein F8M41_006102 [Gigaspora margarita]